MTGEIPLEEAVRKKLHHIQEPLLSPEDVAAVREARAWELIVRERLGLPEHD